jgi:hypothetical protein
MKALLFALGSGVVFAAAALAAGGGFRLIRAAWKRAARKFVQWVGMRRGECFS